MQNFINVNKIKDSLFILIGTLSISLSVVLFFVPHNFTTGGTPGLAILLHHLSGFSIGSMVIAINIPLLIWGQRYLGKMFVVKTIITIALISFFIELFTKYLQIDMLIQNILVASIFGGVIIGFGVGLIIKGNSSAGGSTIVARVLALKTHIKPAQVILISDALIVISSIYVFKDFEKAVLSIMSIYATAKAIDVVLTGTISTKVIHIATNKPEIISKKIYETFSCEGTVLKGTSIYNSEDKTIIFLALDIKKLPKLKEILEENDKDAFMIVMEASQMLGRGH